MADTKWSQFPSASDAYADDEVVGLKNGQNSRFSFAKILALIRQNLSGFFVPTSAKGAANGVASLDSTGKVPGTQLDLSGKQNTITASGILKGDGAGGVTSATAGTDYQAPLTAGTDYATPAQLNGKANPGQIGYPESGTTASRNYTAGDYICWNGLTYTADTNIALGTTLSASGGNKNLTECVGGGCNGLFVTKAFSRTIASIPRYNLIEGTSDVTVAGYVPIAINTFDVDEDHCIIQKLGFTSGNINTLYYRIKNYDSEAVTNVTFVVRVLYARTSLIQL